MLPGWGMTGDTALSISFCISGKIDLESTRVANIIMIGPTLKRVIRTIAVKKN